MTRPANDVPRDRAFYAIDAYGEVQHVEWIGEQGGPFGPYVGVIDSDGDCFPVSDISDWDDDRSELIDREHRRDTVALMELLAKEKGRAEAVIAENEALRLAICGGEDAPGYAASLPLETILSVLRDNYASWRRDSEMAISLVELRRHLELIGLCPLCAGSHTDRHSGACDGPISPARTPHGMQG